MKTKTLVYITMALLMSLSVTATVSNIYNFGEMDAYLGIYNNSCEVKGIVDYLGVKDGLQIWHINGNLAQIECEKEATAYYFYEYQGNYGFDRIELK